MHTQFNGKICTNGVKKHGWALLWNNVRNNGLPALLFSFGLTPSRFIEYGGVLSTLTQEPVAGRFLDIGCGHSLLPTMFKRQSRHGVALDVNLEALRWQKTRQNTGFRGSLEVVCATAELLPFPSSTFSVVCAMSVLEHFADGGDEKAVAEMGRVLQPGGLMLVSVPLSGAGPTCVYDNPFAGIPGLYTRLVGNRLMWKILRGFRVDRGPGYRERHYAPESLEKVFVAPSGCCLEQVYPFRSGSLSNLVLRRMFPPGVLMPLDFFLARFSMGRCDSVESADAVILQLRKPR